MARAKATTRKAKKPVSKSKAPVKAKKAKTTSRSKKAKQVAAPVKAITQKQTKAEIIADLAEELDIDKKTVKAFFAALKSQVTRHMKTRGSGEMTIPELGIKVKRVKKPARKARKGRNPFTGEEIMIAAKPASTIVRATALKACKELAAA